METNSLDADGSDAVEDSLCVREFALRLEHQVDVVDERVVQAHFLHDANDLAPNSLAHAVLGLAVFDEFEGRCDFLNEFIELSCAFLLLAPRWRREGNRLCLLFEEDWELLAP